MANAYNAFDRHLLSIVLADVKATHPGIKVGDAWVWRCGKDHWEFHFDDYYWHGSASTAWEARAKGWEAWLNRNRKED